MRNTLLALVAVVACTILPPGTPRSASALVPLRAAPPAGISVEAKDAPFNKGFDFKFKSGTSSTTVSIDPLGLRHHDTATLSASGGSVTLTGKYDRMDRQIEITARRAGQEIGSYSWRVEAVLR
ncbi:MAG: hypothetical protein RL136_2382 [Planctomycetota bacterium]|jgi:hypothetical protein